MSIKEVKNEIITAIEDFTFVASIELIDETDSAVKYRLSIDDLTFIQVYHNVESGTVNYLLLRNLSRITGRDCCDGAWHKHPFENPHSHDFSRDGQKPSTIQNFLQEVEEILINENLL